MSNVSFTGDGDRRLIARLQHLGPDVRRAVLQSMQRQVLLLARHVKGNKLSGQVLKNRTGHLRASVTSQVADTPAGIVGAVGVYRGPALRYGRFWEYGFSGTVNVRAHQRGPSKRVARRLARYAKRAEALGFDGTLYRGAGIGLVRAHTRRVDQSPRPYLRPGLAERRAAILADLQRAVGGAVRGGA